MSGPSETLQVAPGDVLVTSAGERPTLWQEEPPSPAPGLEERPDARTAVRFSGRSVEVPLSLAAAFAVVRHIYVTSGEAGLESFLRDNDMVQYTTTGPSGGPEVVHPEAVLEGDPLALYRLIKASVDRLDAIRSSALEHIEPAAKEEGLARLKAARAEVESEVRRYFARVGGRGDALRALARDASTADYYLETAFADVRGLLKELRRCRKLIAEAEEADRRVSDAYLRGGPMESEPAPYELGASLGPEQLQVQEYPPLIVGPSGMPEWALHGYGPMVALEEQAAAAHERVQEYVAMAALQYPILWRIFETQNAGALDALGGEMLEVLRDTYAANVDLEAELKQGGDLVWHYAPVVHEAMKNAYVPMFSIAWTAAAEKLAETSGELRFSTQLAMASGVVTLGATGLAALAGASAAAPPLAAAFLLIGLIDRAINLYDALQEYWEYQRQSDAFRATLDPGLALAAEPSVFWTALNVGLSLLALLPGAGAGKAARAVP